MVFEVEMGVFFLSLSVALLNYRVGEFYERMSLKRVFILNQLIQASVLRYHGELW